VVFWITILVLQLASRQFGSRMLRNFIRDTGTQVGLGAFVATFVFSVLTLQVVSDPPELFVPHLSTSVALVLIDLGVLIDFVDHVADTALPVIATFVSPQKRSRSPRLVWTRVCSAAFSPLSAPDPTSGRA
jgi:uncharacterized membrane protein